jgi:ParB family chromosome partitioning protein
MVKKKESEFRSISVELIDIGPEQTRTSKKHLEEGIDELAESIKRFGLLNPVTVYRKNGRFVLVAGQRRLLAVKRLGETEITAKVLDKAPDPIEAKAISLSENILRRDLTLPEKRRACIIFHRRYSSMRAVADALGLPYEEVREYVKYDRLDDELKKVVDEGILTVDAALKAQDLAERPDGSIDIKEAKEVATELQKFNRDQMSNLRDIDKEQPGLSPVEKVEEAKKPRKEKRYTIVLATRHAEGLAKAASDMGGITEEDAAERLLIEGLARGGYV